MTVPGADLHPEPNASPPAPEEEGIPINEFLAQITPRAWVTPTLSALILVGFGIEIALGASPFTPTGTQLLAAGGDFGPLFLEGQWWRAFSAMFLHAGVLHLVFNLWAFLSVGFVTERIFGNRAYLAIYVLSGFAASLTSLAWNPLVVGVGASGAIFGVYGALLSFALLHRGVLPAAYLKSQRNSLVGFLGYNIVFALSQKNIDLAAHVGGFVMGMASGAVLTRDLLDLRAHAGRRILGAAVLAVFLGLAVFGVRNRIATVPAIQARQLADAAYAHLVKEENQEAVNLYTQAISLDATEVSWLANRGLAYSRIDKLELALKDLVDARAIKSTPKTLALLCEVGARSIHDAATIETAATYCTDAIAHDPKNSLPLGMRARLRLEQERHADAIADATAALALDEDYAFARAVRIGARVAAAELDAAEQDCVHLLRPAEPRTFDLRICARVAHLRKERAAERIRLDGLLAKAPADASGLVARALLHEAEGRYAEGIVDYDKAILAKPDAAGAWNNRAWLKVVKGDFAGALSDADRSIALSPDEAYSFGTRCFALAGLGQLAKARSDCARALELRPDSQIDRGMLSFLDKHYVAARRDWEAASSEDPTVRIELRPWLDRLPR